MRNRQGELMATPPLCPECGGVTRGVIGTEPVEYFCFRCELRFLMLDEESGKAVLAAKWAIAEIARLQKELASYKEGPYYGRDGGSDHSMSAADMEQSLAMRREQSGG